MLLRPQRQLVVLHGWKQSAAKMDARWKISEFFCDKGFLVTMPQSKRWGWRVSDADFIASLLLPDIPAVVCGFSDGARTALHVAWKKQLTGLVFHSGLYRPAEVPYLPASTMVIWGAADWTSRLGPFGTNARKFAEDFKDDPDLYTSIHPGRHEWGLNTSSSILWWMDRDLGIYGQCLREWG